MSTRRAANQTADVCLDGDLAAASLVIGKAMRVLFGIDDDTLELVASVAEVAADLLVQLVRDAGATLHLLSAPNLVATRIARTAEVVFVRRLRTRLEGESLTAVDANRRRPRHTPMRDAGAAVLRTALHTVYGGGALQAGVPDVSTSREYTDALAAARQLVFEIGAARGQAMCSRGVAVNRGQDFPTERAVGVGGGVLRGLHVVYLESASPMEQSAKIRPPEENQENI